jgi:hypothetical protein
MGKKDFNATLYSKACRAEGSRPTLRVSELSDRYNPNKNFAGIVLWAHDGEFRWSKDKSNTNYSGRFGYVMIKSTDDWSADDFQRAGQGMVHDKMFRTVLNCACAPAAIEPRAAWLPAVPLALSSLSAATAESSVRPSLMRQTRTVAPPLVASPSCTARPSSARSG